MSLGLLDDTQLETAIVSEWVQLVHDLLALNPRPEILCYLGFALEISKLCANHVSRTHRQDDQVGSRRDWSYLFFIVMTSY